MSSTASVPVVEEESSTGSPGGASATKRIIPVSEHTVEIVADSGEGAQKCGQIFGSICAKMGNGVWTVEIIPAEIEPPPRHVHSTSGNLIRFGTDGITNWGDQTKLIVAFNEQALLSRHRLNALDDECIVLIESMWENHDDESIRKEWKEAMEELSSCNYRIIKVPIEEESGKLVDNPRKGKNMFALGMFAEIYQRDLDLIKKQIADIFRRKPPQVTESNIALLQAGAAWARANLDFQFDIPRKEPEAAQVVMNGNQAAALGAVASGMEFCAMYPITPATSVSHELCDIFESYGGKVHQAEDEIAAACVAIGASYAGKVALTVTSGPGLALKTEALALAVMTEIPLVVLVVQRGGPSTGLPTKVEQSDLLAALYAQPGDAPKVVLAPSTIKDCFHSMVTARRIAETFRTPVYVLSDANLATGVQVFDRPALDPRWQAAPLDLSSVPEGLRPYDWDPKTGLSKRIIPGQLGGQYTLTGLTHNQESKVSYAPADNERGCAMRSRKLAVLQSTLKPPTIYGDDEGDLLIVGWGSTKGAIEEAVDRVREEGLGVSSCYLTFLSPLQPGLKDIFSRFKKVITVEINYSDKRNDPYITDENRRRGQLCTILRASTLVDIDCWTRVPGQPLRPGKIYKVIKAKLSEGAQS